MQTRLLSVALAGVLTGCAASRPYTEESVIRAQRSAPASSHVAAAAAPAEEAAPAPSEPVEQYYPIDNLEHWIALVLDRGARLRLEDGSVWEIAPKDRHQTMLWGVADKIVVARGAYPDHDFQLNNVTKGVSADAKLVVAPK